MWCSAISVEPSKSAIVRAIFFDLVVCAHRQVFRVDDGDQQPLGGRLQYAETVDVLMRDLPVRDDGRAGKSSGLHIAGVGDTLPYRGDVGLLTTPRDTFT